MLLQFEKRMIQDCYEAWQKPQLGQYMQLEQAKAHAYLAALQGWGAVKPNPMVGCLLLAPVPATQELKLIGIGWHRQELGGFHAEEDAMQDALSHGYGELLAGSVAVVSLEPCSHQGRRPPCTELLKRHKIAELHYGLQDPDSRVNGRGIASLREAGIICQVWSEAWQQRLRSSLEIFIKNRTTNQPFISMKAGMSLDGSIAFQGDQRRFITDSQSQRFAHFLRLGHDAVMVGMGTLLADNPSLTVRAISRGEERAKKKLHKIIYDPDGRFTDTIGGKAAQLNLWQDAERVMLLTHRLSMKAISGIEILTIAREDFSELPARLMEQGIFSLLLEGGHLLYNDFLQNDLVDQAYLIVAPKIFLGGPRVFLTSQQGERQELQAEIEDFTPCGEDMIYSLRCKSNESVFSKT